MTLSIADKNYWTEELSRAIHAKILILLRQANDPGLVERSKEITKSALKDELGLDSLFADAEAYRLKRDALREEANKIDKQYDHELQKVRAILEAHYVEKKQTNSNYWRGKVTLDEMIEQIVERQYLPTLTDLSETGAEVAVFLRAINNLERTIMLATSTTQVRQFVEDFCKKFGLDLAADTF